MHRADLAIVCDLTGPIRLPSPKLHLLQALLSALPPALVRRSCVFLALDPAEGAGRSLLLPWIEALDLRCRCIAVGEGEPAARALAIARSMELLEARSVLLVDGLGPAAVLGGEIERRAARPGHRRTRWSAVLLEPALLRLARQEKRGAAPDAAPDAALQQEAALESAAFPLLDFLWLPDDQLSALRSLGVALPAGCGPYRPPCLLADSLQPWLTAATASPSPPQQRPPWLLWFGPLRPEPDFQAFLQAVEESCGEGSGPGGLTAVAPAGAAVHPAALLALASLEERLCVAVEVLTEDDLPRLAGRLAEPRLAAVAAAGPAGRSEALALCRHLGLPTLEIDEEPLAGRLGALLGRAAAIHPPPPVDEGASGASGGAPADFASRLLGLHKAATAGPEAPPGDSTPPRARVAVAVRGQAEDPELRHTLLSLQHQSLPAARILLMQEAGPPGQASARLPRLLDPLPMPQQVLSAADPEGCRTTLARLDADFLLLLRAGDVLTRWALERLAAAAGELEAGEALVLPVAGYRGVFFPDLGRLELGAMPTPATGSPRQGGGSTAVSLLDAPEPLLLPPRLLAEGSAALRPYPSLACLRRVPAQEERAAAAVTVEGGSAGTAELAQALQAACEGAAGPGAVEIVQRWLDERALAAGGAGPDRRLRQAAVLLGENPPVPGAARGRSTARPRASDAPPYAGLLLAYTPRAGAALLLSALQRHGRIGVAAREAFAGVPASRQLDHLALLRGQARGLRRRRFVLRAQLAHCADPPGLARSVKRQNLAVVVLLRLNQVCQVVSQLNAERCRLRYGIEHPCEPLELPPLQLAPGLLEERLSGLAAMEQRLESVLEPLMERAPGRVYLLTYEQLLADLPTALDSLTGLLGLPATALDPTTRKLTPPALSQALAEQAALLELYRGSPLAAQLADLPAAGLRGDGAGPAGEGAR